MTKTIALGLYTGSYCSGSYGMNLLSIAWELNKKNMWGGQGWASSCRVDSNRNVLIHDFLHSSDCDYLFILDEDMIHPPMAPIALAEHNLPIVSGLYFHRGTDGVYAPHFYKHEGESPDTRRGYDDSVNNYYRSMSVEVANNLANRKNGVPYSNGPIVLTREDGSFSNEGLMEIDAGGFGCLLISREAAEKLTPPYLHDEPGLNGDLAFYKKAKAAGVKIYGDCNVICAHNSSDYIGLASFSDYANKSYDEFLAATSKNDEKEEEDFSWGSYPSTN